MEDYKDAEERKNDKRKNPYESSNIFGKLCFIWMLPLFFKGYKRDLLESDLYPHLSSHESAYLGNKLHQQWIKELKNNPEDPSLWKCIVCVFRRQFFALAVCHFFTELFVKLAQPLFLSRLLDYFELNSTMPKSEAYFYAAAIGICSLISQTVQHTFMLQNFHLGMKVRVATSSLIYRKALKLNKSALAETTIGQMVNLISNDVGRFEMTTSHIQSLWMAPLETVIVLLLIYFYVGFSGMIGIVVILLFIPFQMWMGKKTSKFRLATAIRTDERIRLMNEIISGIQVIKMYTWEKPFAKLVEFSRRREIDEIKKVSVIRGLMMSFTIFLNRAAIYTCVLTYVLTGHILSAQYVYVLQSLYGILRMTVTMFFAQGVTQLAEANISVKRIRKFLLYDEVEFDSSSTFFNSLESKEDLKAITSNGKVQQGPVGVDIKNAFFKWIKSQSDNTLESINFHVGSGQLAAIIGSVGSGKTTLLHAILGELIPTEGNVKVIGKLSYASQEPWLFVGSVRQNITFGQVYNARKYHEVIRVCQLQRDFSLFPYGDRTIIGERGISLSGGQRSRINLARAVYKDADIYLLDDPLSAVDAHVGKRIFEECIVNYLKNKCVILVTHQLQYLKDVKTIYLFGNGKISYSGTYDEIQNTGNEFAQLLNDLKDVIDEEDGLNDEQEMNAEVVPQKRIRRVSTKEIIPKDQEEPKIEKEGRGSGKVSWYIYKSYFLSGGNWCKIISLFIVFVSTQGFASLCDYFLTIWVNMNQIERAESLLMENNETVLLNQTVEQTRTAFQNFWFTYLNNDILVLFYTTAIISLVVLTIVRSLAFYRFANKASIVLHNNMFYKIVYATMKFFNTNPSGRILNRFSKDMNQVDEMLPTALVDTFQIALIVLAISLIIASVNPWMFLVTTIMLIIFYLLRIFFLATSRDIKRLEGITRSPVYSHLTASLQGLTTIRAFGAQKILKEEFDNYQNSYSSAYFMFLGANRTFGFWLDMHCVIFIALVTLSFVFMGSKTLGGNVGLAITQAIQLTGMFQWGMRQWSELENIMTCVERIKEYADVIPEENNETALIDKSWPQKGTIAFDKLSMSYAPSEPFILKDVTFKVASGEKIGIVGRTGAGKSSIIISLFKLAYNQGKIFIDDIDINRVPLSQLRSSIAIIPQEPVLFSSSLRKNLDPFDEYTDDVLWDTLDQVELKTAVSELPHGLESKMSEGGSNFSVGQRQLVCLARAIIRKNRILLLDEATANVDPHTDGLIQATIRSKFTECTVLTIAHRLHTIMDSDKVLVMDAGRNVEFDCPFVLLENKGVFSELVQQTGKAMAENLYGIAQENYKNKVQ